MTASAATAGPARPGSRRHPDRWRDDTGSMPFALLITLTVLSLSALLTPLVLVQVQATKIDAERVEALHAAQAGIDIAVAQFRAASTGLDADGNPVGDLAKLPCTAAAPLEGDLGPGTPGRYRVIINYFAFNPLPADYLDPTRPTWIDDNDLNCPTTTPAHALIRSQGSGGESIDDDGCVSNVRCLRAVYGFRTTNAIPMGGLIHTYQPADLCWDAGLPPWTAGRQIKVQPCVEGHPQQTWAYDKNLNVILAASRTATTPALCLDTVWPHAAGNIMTLQPCLSPAPPRQRWSLDAGQNLLGTAGDNLSNDAYCLNVDVYNVAGSLLRLGTGSNCDHRTWRTYVNMDSTVGPGAAGQPGTLQLVNFEQFGRCIDIPLTGPEWNYLSSYPCKQKPDIDDIEPNEQWILPTFAPGAVQATGKIRSVMTDQWNQDEPGPYCLLSSGIPDGYVDAEPCANNSPGMTWTVYRDTGDYTTGYRIVSGTPSGTPPVYGLCLAAKSEHLGDFREYPAGVPLGYHTSKIIASPCSASTLQKWNAPPSFREPAPLRNIGER